MWDLVGFLVEDVGSFIFTVALTFMTCFSGTTR